MTYLDYSATTPVSEEVLESFCQVSRKYIGNPNSLHRLGTEANEMINKATNQIADILKDSQISDYLRFYIAQHVHYIF